MQTSTRLKRTALVAATCLAAALITACGSGTDDVPEKDATSTNAAFPVTVKSGPLSAPTDLTLDAAPKAIVSLSPTATETLWAIDAGDQVVAVDSESDFPEGVPTTKLSGFEPNVEAILGYSPDLVIAAQDAGGLVAGLEKAGVPVLLLPAPEKLDEAWSQMERLGAATGHPTEAAALVKDVTGALAKAVESSEGAAGKTYFHELDATGFTVSSTTFIGQLYSEFGLKSIADEAKSGDDYPQLSSEYVVSADPDLIMLADVGFGDVTVENVAKRPGWADMSAVKGGNVVGVDPDIASRWGPRLADFAELIGDAAAKLTQAS